MGFIARARPAPGAIGVLCDGATGGAKGYTVVIVRPVPAIGSRLVLWGADGGVVRGHAWRRFGDGRRGIDGYVRRALVVESDRDRVRRGPRMVRRALFDVGLASLHGVVAAEGIEG